MPSGSGVLRKVRVATGSEERMGRILQPFRRLHWQLTLTYVLITLVAALTVEAANVVGALTASKTLTWSASDKLIGDMTWIAPQLAPYLDTSAPNVSALAADAAALAQTIGVERPAARQSLDKNGSALPRNPAFMVKSRGTHVSVAVLDTNNQVLAAASSDSTTAGGATADTSTQVAVDAALAGGLHGKLPQFTATLDDGRTVGAVPLTSLDGRQVGLLVVAVKVQLPPAQLQTSVDLVLTATGQQDLLPSAFYFILLSCFIGTLSGLLASRSIRRRLGRIAQAARLWSQGELRTAIPKPGGDELGQVALDLNSMAAQLEQLMAAREVLAVVEERHRLARDLHDSVKQQLFVVTMLLGTAREQAGQMPETEQTGRTLAEAERLAAHAQQELTALIRALRPVALANKGLSAAIRELVADWTGRSGIVVRASIADELPLGLVAEQELFRVAQEALANVARHSGAAAVELAVQISGETVLLSVADDGHGFDPAAQANGGQGLGMAGMRERVAALGGELLVYSSIEGTRVEARVPVASSSPPSSVNSADMLAAGAR
jgi:NarL family two-component system sensor histidine kinase LiaS